MTGSKRQAPGRRSAPTALPPAEIARWLDTAAAHYAAGRLDEARRGYERIEARNPNEVRAAYSLATIDIRQGRLTSAATRLKRVVRRDPGLFQAQHNLGYVSQSLGQWADAAAAYGRAHALRPEAAETELNLAAALAVVGRADEAIRHYRALAADPALGLQALTRAALLNAKAISDAELDTLRRAAGDENVDADTRIGLLFALGEVLESRNLDDDAFAAFAAGNRLKADALAAAGPASRPEAVALAHARSIETIERLFTAEFIAAHRGAGSTAAAPIFIVGMPRSGSTLIEQILASHRGVQGMGESPVLSDTLDGQFPFGPPPPSPATHFRALAERYLEGLRARGWTRKFRPVDKTLEAWLHIGMIHLMFPRATILHSMRDPVDTCLACFRQLFVAGEETLYDLRLIGAEYVGYRRLMDHWRAVLPGRVIDVSHEALVADPDAQIRRLVTEACGLPWDDNCLRFHETSRAVTTASAAQVRQPIFTTSIARWRRYERHLGPLFEALGPYAPKDVG